MFENQETGINFNIDIILNQSKYKYLTANYLN